MYNGAFVACPDPIDFRAYTIDQHLRGQERLHAAGRGRQHRAPGDPQLPGRDRSPRSATRTTWSSHRATAAAPAASTTSGRRCSRRWARTAIRGAAVRQADRRHRPDRSPPTGASTSTCRTSSRATGRRWRRSCRGKLHIYVGVSRHLLPHRRGVLRPGAAREPASRRTRARSPTASAPSTAGTATRSCRTPIRACTTTIQYLPHDPRAHHGDRARPART